MGHYRAYSDKKLSNETLDLIRAADTIVTEYEDNGHMLTVRQLYYQFVTQNLIPNTDASYNRLVRVISDGRMAGLISWTAIEDRGRNLRGLNHVSSPSEALSNTLASYRTDLWATQPFRPEVWVEKEALVGVIGASCNDHRVDFFACKGYNSQSEQWRAGRRLADYISRGQTPIIFHLGDHDPSGIDMTRDNRERLAMFAGVPIMVVRIALNMHQIEELRLPPNPAKISDSRFDEYKAVYNTESSWELDALDPKYVHQLIGSHIEKVKDEKLWADALEEETDDKNVLERLIEETNYEQE